MLILYEPTPEPPGTCVAVCDNTTQWEVALDADGKPATARRIWFLLEFVGSLSARPDDDA